METPNKKRPLWQKIALTTMLIVSGVALLIHFMPRGYNQDLSQIGQGKPVMVQVYDHNVVPCKDLMHALDGIRDAYVGKVEFLVADIDTPQGRAFAQSQGVSAITLVFFGPDGKRVADVYGAQDQASLRKLLAQVFHL